jgi:hypothetical protein
MTLQAEAVLQEALKLPAGTAIVGPLLESLEPQPDVDIEAAWRHYF